MLFSLSGVSGAELQDQASEDQGSDPPAAAPHVGLRRRQAGHPHQGLRRLLLHQPDPQPSLLLAVQSD